MVPSVAVVALDLHFTRNFYRRERLHVYAGSVKEPQQPAWLQYPQDTGRFERL